MHNIVRKYPKINWQDSVSVCRQLNMSQMIAVFRRYHSTAVIVNRTTRVE